MMEKASVRAMKLPNLENAVVPDEKITGYLLSATHRDGRHKAAFFTRFGFSIGSPEELAAALLRHAAEHEVVIVEDSPFGTRFGVEGTIETPSGRTPAIRSVWFVEEREETPRLVTAYPIRGNG